MNIKKINKFISRLTLSLLLVLSSIAFSHSKSYAAADYTQSTNGTYTWTVPAGVTSATVQVWGAGGGGGGSYASTVLELGWNGGGGGGGEFRQKYFSNLTPGNTYSVVVGAGGAYGTAGNNGTTGGSSTFGGTLVKAFGGTFGTGSKSSGPGSGGSGGSGGTGDFGYSGGSGSSDSGTGGGGGSSAGTSSAGTNSTSNSGGSAPSGGGNGGAVGNGGSVFVGYSGSSPGGGGGGGGYRVLSTNWYSYRGGAGADGKVAITYNPVVTSTTSNMNVAINPVITISSAGLVSLSVIPTNTGLQSFGSDTVTVTTNDVSGYTVSISMDNVNTYLSSGANTIPAISSLAPANSTLTASNSSWGFCVADNTILTTPNCPSLAANNVALGTYTFAQVPSIAGAFVIKSQPASSTGYSNDSTTVWYGAAVNSSQPSGTYSATVIYTAVTL